MQECDTGERGLQPPPPFDLRCEYLTDPLGVDVQRPRLSWLLDHPATDQRQTAYRVVVSSSLDLVSALNGDLWDSGKIESPATHLVRYDGAVLRVGQRCYWRVQWWDAQDRSSDFSEPAMFETGPQGRDDWGGIWISKRNCAEFASKGTVLLGEFLGDYVQTHAVYLRKKFHLTSPVDSASVIVCGLGYYELRINGGRVGDRVLDPGQTDYRRKALYSTYDISSLLKERTETKNGGDFAVGIILGNGRHIKNYGFDSPKVIAQLAITYSDGTSATFVTDASWRVSHGPLRENGIYFGERYDARLELDGWDRPSFDDSSWEAAVEVEGYPLASQMLPPIRVAATVTPVLVSLTHGQSRIYDCGQNMAGWVRMSVHGPRGTVVQLRHSELLNENNALNVSPNQNAEATDYYVLRGEGTESYQPSFTYHGFRYFEISGSPSLPEIVALEACSVHTDVEFVGTFRCSNELLNKVHENIVRGQLSNLMSIPTDCAQRDERHGWLGDAHLAAEESMFNFDMAAFYRKYLGDIQLAQKEDGSLPDLVPPYTGRLYPADPAWSSAYVTIAWLVYMMYGDEDILDEHYESMHRYVTFLRTSAENHIVRLLGKYGDWCPPGSIAPKRTPVELTATWYYYHDTVVLARIARVLGQTKDTADLNALGDEIRDAFNKEFLDNGDYKVNRFAPVDRSAGQTSNALPLYLKMVPPAWEKHVLGRLLQSVVEERDYHLDTGILGTRYLLDVLTQMGHGDVAYKVASQRTYPGWGYMVEEGATTLWERWEKITGGGMNSHNHIMLGSVDSWFYRTLAGISCIQPGWNRIAINPRIFDGLNSAEAAIKTVKGEVGVSWSRDERSMCLECRIPVGSSAEISFPFPWKKMVVTCQGRTIWSNGSVDRQDVQNGHFVSADAEHAHFVYGSGRYEFRMSPAGEA
jgi:alpha-L-rhamnosidase